MMCLADVWLGRVLHPGMTESAAGTSDVAPIFAARYAVRVDGEGIIAVRSSIDQAMR